MNNNKLITTTTTRLYSIQKITITSTTVVLLYMSNHSKLNKMLYLNHVHTPTYFFSKFCYVESPAWSAMYTPQDFSEPPLLLQLYLHLKQTVLFLHILWKTCPLKKHVCQTLWQLRLYHIGNFPDNSSIKDRSGTETAGVETWRKTERQMVNMLSGH